jgi:hypothetical protein
MIIVFGTRSGSSDTRLATPCNNCRQPALVQSDWYRYFHLMFIPTFPVGSQRTIHCAACDSSYETKGNAPIWTFLGSMLFVIGLLGAAGLEALRHFSVGASSASVASAASAPSPSASATAAASASTPPLVAARPAAAASARAGAPAGSASGARPVKRKK